jgi:hypothetical protein
MASFSFNLDFFSEQLPNANWMLLNIPAVLPKPTEISADMDIETIAEIVSDKLMEIVKRSFESKTPNVSKSEISPILQTSLLSNFKTSM